MIQFLTTKKALEMWDELAQRISASLAHDPYGLTATTVLQLVESDQAYIAVDWQGDEIDMVAVFQLAKLERGPYLALIALEGQNMREWLTPLVELSSQVAKAAKCQGMLFAGRPGWTKVLKSTGFKHSQSVMQMEF